MNKKLVAFICLMAVITTSSCTLKKQPFRDIPYEEETSDNGTPTDTENPTVEVLEKDAEPKQLTTEDILNSIGAVINREKEIDSTASNFVTALTSGDKDTVASMLGGRSVYYPWLNNNPVEEISLLPLDIVMDGYEYTNEYRRSYLCEIISNAENSPFTSSVGAYYLETSDISELGNPVYYFLPLEDAKNILSPMSIPEEFSYFTQQLSDAYESTFVIGENPASSIDFNNVQGFHFIPHTMFNFGYVSYWERPHSMTEINRFISECFYENPGVTLSSNSDYDLWVSKRTGFSSYSELSPDDKIYGCFNGHGGTWVMSQICGYEETKSSITVTLQTYADYAHFTKAKRMIFSYAPHVDGKLPLLESVEVVEDTGYPTAYGSI